VVVAVAVAAGAGVVAGAVVLFPFALLLFGAAVVAAPLLDAAVEALDGVEEDAAVAVAEVPVVAVLL
jgi:hypothetical protein